jgi:hypothetical protein
MADTFNEYSLANIARVEIETEETSPKTYRLINVADEATIEAFVSEGEEKELRVKNVIKAQNKTEDIVKGYNIKLNSVTMQPEILALVDGGTWDSETKKYTAPVIGTPVTKTKFILKVYTEDKDTDGETNGYVVFSFAHCSGKPVNYSIKDGEFFVEELNAISRPKFGESPVEFEYIETLPA